MNGLEAQGPPVNGELTLIFDVHINKKVNRETFYCVQNIIFMRYFCVVVYTFFNMHDAVISSVL